jgi:hypothetical protein
MFVPRCLEERLINAAGGSGGQKTGTAGQCKPACVLNVGFKTRVFRASLSETSPLTYDMDVYCVWLCVCVCVCVCELRLSHWQ